MRKLILPILLVIACSSGPEKSIDRAELLIEKGRLREAIAVLEKSEEENPTPRVHYLLGLSYCKIRDIDQAEKYFDLALSEDSSYTIDIVEAYTFLGKEYCRNSQLDLATRAFENVLKLSPYTNLGEYFYLMGDYYYERENYEEAIDYYQKGLLSAPDSKRASQSKLNIVLSYSNLGKKLDALDLCEKYLKTGKNEDLLYQKGAIAYELALEFFRQDSLKKCTDCLNKVIDAGQPIPLQDDAYFLLGEINLKMGEYEKAKSNFERVLRLNPYGGSQLVRDARERLKLIEQMEGNK